MGLFSVLIPHYNVEQYVEDAIKSVVLQTNVNWELVIVDDGSSSASRDKLSEFVNQYQRMTDNQIKLYFNEMNRGVGFTMRECIEASQGDLCAFLGADDALSADAIDIMEKTHQQHAGASLVHSTHYQCDANMNVVKRLSIKNHKEGISHLENHTVTSFCSFKKSKYLETEGIDKKYIRAADQDLYYKMEEVGDVIFVDEALYYYRRHATNISLNENLIGARFWHLEAMRNAFERRGIDFRLLEKKFIKMIKDLPDGSVR